MKALQYIYTSWKNGDSTEKGYMIYSCSEGISDVECTAIKDAMQYLAPKELPLTPTPQEIEDVFPYSFSYFILPTGRGCVAQSTYLGKDYSGRYGNYIIYALVFDIDELPCLPAELFSESYIKTSMMQEELDAPSPVPPLPALDITEYASVINDDQINEFIMDMEDEFAQLISLVLSAQDSKVPFYINDTRENLVLWSAAFQRMLPPSIAKSFMFNTYVGDHDFMRSQRAKAEGLNFHLIGVRPDANFFDYATEYMSSRQIVMDFIGGHMTEGIAPNSFSQAMASSMSFNYEETDAFGEFVDSTSFREINGGLQDAYLYFQLLKNDEFEFSNEAVRAVLSFGLSYCSDEDNSLAGSKLLTKYEENDWTLDSASLELLWKFICRYTDFMKYSLFDLLTVSVFRLASESEQGCTDSESLLLKIQNETPDRFKEYVEYFNSADCMDRLTSYFDEKVSLFTYDFYIRWLIRYFSFSDDSCVMQPAYKLLSSIMRKIAETEGSERKMTEILFSVSEKSWLFEKVLTVFMDVINGTPRLDLLCACYTDIAESMTDVQLNRFERHLTETSATVPFALKLYVREIESSSKPEEEFWRIYENQSAVIITDPEFDISLIIRACLDNEKLKNPEVFAADVLRRIDTEIIRRKSVLGALIDTLDGCSVKSLAKYDLDFIRRICEIGKTTGNCSVDRLNAVLFGEELIRSAETHSRSIILPDITEKINVTPFEKADYELYVKKYFDSCIDSMQVAEDASMVFGSFFHPRYFSDTANYFISLLKKMKKKETERWKRILGWTCVFLVNADSGNSAAEELCKPVMHYLRSLEETELYELRQTMIQIIPASRCEYLFEEARRKEGFSEKLSNLFHKK